MDIYTGRKLRINIEMKQILSLTDQPKQQFNISVPGYDVATIYMEYKPLQYAWFMNLTWGTFILKNERISNSPNLLRQWQDIIPFGIMIAGVDDADPVLQESWVGYNTFWIIDSTEFTDVEAVYVRL